MGLSASLVGMSGIMIVGIVWYVMRHIEFLLEKKQKQAKTDVILDKISKSGYESLTKAEKEFLFSQSKNG
jgi:hypothetical protein